MGGGRRAIAATESPVKNIDRDFTRKHANMSREIFWFPPPARRARSRELHIFEISREVMVILLKMEPFVCVNCTFQMDCQLLVKV